MSIHDKIRTLKQKIFHEPSKITEFWNQVYEKGVDPKTGKELGWRWNAIKRRLVDQDLVDHFTRDYRDFGNTLQGTCLGFRPAMGKDLIVKRMVVDLDNLENLTLFQKTVLPVWDKLGFDWIVEWGRPDGKGNYHGAHYSLMTEAPFTMTKAFLRQLFGEAGQPIFPHDADYLGNPFAFDEVSGGNKHINNLRFIHGFHIKRMFRGPVEYHGDLLEESEPIIDAFIKAKPVTLDFMKGYIKEDFFPTAEEEKKKKSFDVKWTPDEWKYNPLGLDMPKDSINLVPSRLRPVFRNCQAANWLLNDVYKGKETNLQEGMIQEKGQQHHDGGLAFAGIFRYHDVKYDSKEGKEAWKAIKEDNRGRSDKDHYNWHGADKEAHYYMWNCKTYDEYFDKCQGCPFAGQIDSPRVFTYSSTTPISKKLLSTDIRLVTLKQIRENTFPKITKKLRDLVQELD
jgi:hypothetical protein